MVLSPLCNIVYPCSLWICIMLRLSIVFIGSRSTWDHFCRQGTPSMMANLSSFFFFLLATLPRPYSFDMPWPISTKLGHKNPWPMTFMSYNQSGVKGHEGGTGIKNSKSQKRYSSFRLQGMITWLMYVTLKFSVLRDHIILRNIEFIFYEICHFAARLLACFEITPFSPRLILLGASDSWYCTCRV